MGAESASTWPWFKGFLRKYEYRWALAARMGLVRCPGAYLCLSFFVLIGTGVATTYATTGSFSWLLTLAWAVSAAYVIDSLLVHTAIAYVTRNPDSPLRSMLLTFLAFVNIVLAFAVIYSVHGHRFASPLKFPGSVFYSVSVATTYGDKVNPVGTGAEFLIMLQLLVSLYFFAVIVAIIAAWAGSATDEARKRGTRLDQNEEGLMAKNPQEPWIGTKWETFAAAANRGLGGQGFVVHAAMKAARSNTWLTLAIIFLMVVQIAIAVVQEWRP